MKNSLLFFVLHLVVFSFLAVDSSYAQETESPVHTFTLWQLPTVTEWQNMSYVIETDGSEVIVIDGGNPEDYVLLLDLFADNDIDRVDAWFISHVHGDHFGALIEILERDVDLEIGAIYSSIPDPDWMNEMLVVENSRVGNWTISLYNRFQEALIHSHMEVTDLTVEDIEIGALTVEVLRVWNPEITFDAINNSCIVLRITDGVNSILFLGDLACEASVEMLEGTITPGITDRLPSDYVQISHHGLNGVRVGFYERVQPKWALWPAPLKWYEPDSEDLPLLLGVGLVRAQMLVLGIGEDERFVSGRDGLTEFRFTIPSTQPGVVYMENAE